LVDIIASEREILMDDKICPKCSTPMNLAETMGAIPKHIGEGARLRSDKTPAISTSDVLTVTLYYCPSCRFVELYAA
jgi:hypothetical protein